MTNLNRRRFLVGAGALLAAPAVLKVDGIMPIRRPRLVLIDTGTTDFGCMHTAAFRDPMTGMRYGFRCPGDLIARRGQDRFIQACREHLRQRGLAA